MFYKRCVLFLRALGFVGVLLVTNSEATTGQDFSACLATTHVVPTDPIQSQVSGLRPYYTCMESRGSPVNRDQRECTVQAVASLKAVGRWTPPITPDAAREMGEEKNRCMEGRGYTKLKFPPLLAEEIMRNQHIGENPGPSS
jgi:hypothetical protein